MTLKPFYNEEAVQVGDDTYRLVINFGAIDAAEGMVGEPFDSILERVTRPDCPNALAGKVLWALLRQHHPEVTLDQIAGVLFSDEGAAMGLAMGRLLKVAFAEADGSKAKGANPPKRRGASKSS